MMFFSRLSKRERYIAYIVIALIAFVSLERAVFSPVMNKLQRLNKEIILQEGRLEKSINLLALEDSIINEYKEYSQYIKQDSSDEEAIAMLLSTIEKTAENTSVSFLDMKPSSAQKTKYFKKYSVRIEAEAEMTHLVDFMYQLEKLPQLLRVVEFRLSSEKKETSVLKFFIEITEILII